MSNFKDRRDRLVESIKGDFVLLAFSGTAPMRSEDEAYPFTVDRSFFYLTGLEKESMVLMLSRIGNVKSESLFILPFDEVQARWVGGRMSKKEASSVSGVLNVYDLGDLEGSVSRIINRNRANSELTFYLDLWHYVSDQAFGPGLKFANELRKNYPNVKVADYYGNLAAMRLIKDDEEISSLLKAISITKAGVEKMMKTIKPGMNEMVMEGVFDFVLKQNLCNENAFHTIAASGPRATILHYGENNQVMNDGELFLCDLGATYDHYCADISRTFPVNGKFSPRQRELYQLVLNAQKIVAKNAKPGLSLKDLNNLVVDYYREELPKHGLNKGVSEYYFHGVSHQLGLDTHDVDGGLGSILKPGMVITNEPGLYVADEGIGIRIEDDLLITEKDAIVLSKDIIKEINDIEALMKN